jgi:hypothetical protein
MRNSLTGFALLLLLSFASRVYGQTPASVGRTVAAAEPRMAAKAAEVESSGSTPDLSGVWRRPRRPPDNMRKYTLFDLVFALSDAPPMTAWGNEKFNAAKPNGGPRAVSIEESNDPVFGCFPPGVPRVYLQRGGPLEILQAPGRVVMYFEYDHFVREIYTDGRQHTADLNPTWMGEPLGKWEGDTLVVDTVGFNDKTWIDNLGHPHSDALHLVERIRRVNHDTLTNDITIDDPKAYTKPWTTHMSFELKQDWKIEEVVCEDNVNFSNLQKISESKK